MRALSGVIPPDRDRRVLALVTLAATIGKGIFLTAGVLFFTRAVHLPAVQVGAGLSIAGLIALLAGVAAGHLADRRGARECYVGALGIGAAATFTLLFARDFWSFLVPVTVAIAAQAAGMVVRGPVINQIAGAKPQPLRAYVRATTNVGIALGAALAGWAAQRDTVGGYRWLIVANALILLVAALTAVALPHVPPAGAQHPGQRWTAVRDLPYLSLAVLDGVLSIQYRILTVAIPLWIVVATGAPRWLVSAAVVLNTAIIVLFQVRASRNVDTPQRAGRTMRRAGLMFLLACALISSAAGAPGWAAATLLLTGIVVHTVGELWQAAGGFELSNELAPKHAVGQYLGVFGIGMGLAESFGPVLLVSLCIEWGRPGWYVVGALLAGAGLLVPPVVRWSLRTRIPVTHPEPSLSPG
ncbi:MFS transporter [Micromonospora tarensis]|uniref:MFS transporter n=1 Tax=Micromonospora tarensis TaxID=2806100 RepID=A0ABS1YC78_9ACTN|nr:MFS transporter [Micromonospora tarensis]MBM0274965.1 MFS transporter [Micromonospora tarensis]